MSNEKKANIKAGVVALLLGGLITLGIMGIYDEYVSTLQKNVAGVLELPW